MVGGGSRTNGKREQGTAENSKKEHVARAFIKELEEKIKESTGGARGKNRRENGVKC